MYRKAKMIFTLGPATDRPGVLRSLVRSGMNAARLNFSHGTHAEHARRFHALKAIAAAEGREVAVLMDLCGPKIRVGELPGNAMDLHPGQRIRVVPRKVSSDPAALPIPCPACLRALNPGQKILLDDGAMRLVVKAQAGDALECQVVTGGRLLSHKGVNLPDAVLPVAALTVKDKGDLKFGLGLGVDWVALSFVRHPRDLIQLRTLLGRLRGRAGIVAKIEKPEAVEHLVEVIALADGLMIARGDLGVEMELEQIPVLQKKIIRAANRQGKWVITATQMLQSMITNPNPTRAEASDVANAIFDGSDAVMLSGETAAGAFPKQAAAIMVRIITQAERMPEYLRLAQTEIPVLDEADTLVEAAVRLANADTVKAIVVFTNTGRTARLLARRRPQAPIIVLVHHARVARALQLVWGIHTHQIDKDPPVTAVVAAAQKHLLRSKLLKPGDRIVIVASSPAKVSANFIKVHCLGQPV
jgi:pyruvate kinase